VSYSVRKYFTYFGLPYTASLEEVKAVYRKMAKRLHPDRNKSTNAHDEFTELQQNYDALTKYIESGRQSTANTYYYQKPKPQPAPKVRKTRREIIQEKLRAEFNQSVNQYINSPTFRLTFYTIRLLIGLN
jgi:curved DNA-binding protein CbpA